MKAKLSKIFDRTFLLYLLLGLLNYGVCNAIMLVVRFTLHVPQTYSLILEFALQTMISFLLNRYVTFKGIQISKCWPLMFFVSVGASYLIAKVFLLKLFEILIVRNPLVQIANWLQSIFAKNADPDKFRESLVMLATTMIYCIVNYIGQRYYVFRPRKQDKECLKQPADRTDAEFAPDPSSAQEST